MMICGTCRVCAAFMAAQTIEEYQRRESDHMKVHIVMHAEKLIKVAK